MCHSWQINFLHFNQFLRWSAKRYSLTQEIKVLKENILQTQTQYVMLHSECHAKIDRMNSAKENNNKNKIIK